MKNFRSEAKKLPQSDNWILFSFLTLRGLWYTTSCVMELTDCQQVAMIYRHIMPQQFINKNYTLHLAINGLINQTITVPYYITYLLQRTLKNSPNQHFLHQLQDTKNFQECGFYAVQYTV